MLIYEAPLAGEKSVVISFPSTIKSSKGASQGAMSVKPHKLLVEPSLHHPSKGLSDPFEGDSE